MFIHIKKGCDWWQMLLCGRVGWWIKCVLSCQNFCLTCEKRKVSHTVSEWWTQENHQVKSLTLARAAASLLFPSRSLSSSSPSSRSPLLSWLPPRSRQYFIRSKSIIVYCVLLAVSYYSCCWHFTGVTLADRIVTFYWTQIRSKSTILAFLSKPSSQLAASQVSPTFYQARVQSFCTHSSLGQLWLKLYQDFEAED